MAATGALLLAATIPAACAADSKAPEEESCTSGRTVSKRFNLDPAATDDRSTWLTGVEIATVVPEEAISIKVSYRNQNGDWSAPSQTVSSDRAGRIGMLIGNKDVYFGTQLVASNASPLCHPDYKPKSQFLGPMSRSVIEDQDLTLTKWEQ
ncbi:MAG TPA: hypothetical protein VF572_06700 [Candidatus Saccharimonadales bacterium]|jgi:hypothetical protein